jgi:tetratricopeptide (TPR) repeat protein
MVRDGKSREVFMRQLIYTFIFLFLAIGSALAFPRTGPEYFKMGTRFYQQMDFQGALFSFEAGLVLLPNSAPGYQGLGNAYYSLGRPQDALAAYQKSLTLNPKNDKLAAWVEKVKLQAALPDGMVAVKDVAVSATPMETTVSANVTPTMAATPNTASVYFKMGTKLYEAMDFQGALLNFQAGLALVNSAPGYQGLGNCYYSLGRSQEALSAYQKSLALNPNNPHLTSFVETIKSQAAEGMVMVKDTVSTATPIATPPLSTPTMNATPNHP